MNLAALLESALGRDALDPALRLPDVAVSGVAQDHRRVAPGFVFVARRGGSADGHRFARLAVERGAVAVVGELPGLRYLPWRKTPYIRVNDDRAAVAKLAAAFYGWPSRQLAVLGVTGTDGKTTTSFLLHHLLSGQHKTGLLSTAGIRLGEEALELEGHFTTPEATEVQRLLARFRDEGCRYAVLESSSHGFAQRRLDEVGYRLGIWTNLSPEHLDFHRSLEAYREAKATLVRRAELSVLSRDDEHYPFFAAAAQRHLSYGLHQESDYRASDLAPAPGGQQFRLHVRGERAIFEVGLPMVGSYNVHNALAALAAAHRLGLPLPELVSRLASFPGVPGRMQLVQSEPFAVVVDFAHTAPALEKALAALRPATRGRLIVLIGAAGERDPGKRGPLGEVAARAGDLVVLTEEDSRSEDIGEILAAMLAGAHSGGAREGETVWRVPDRREAIIWALELAQAGDTVLLSGKGHERTLERARETLPWDEAAEARRALAKLEAEALREGQGRRD